MVLHYILTSQYHISNQLSLLSINSDHNNHPQGSQNCKVLRVFLLPRTRECQENTKNFLGGGGVMWEPHNLTRKCRFSQASKQAMGDDDDGKLHLVLTPLMPTTLIQAFVKDSHWFISWSGLHLVVSCFAMATLWTWCISGWPNVLFSNCNWSSLFLGKLYPSLYLHLLWYRAYIRAISTEESSRNTHFILQQVRTCRAKFHSRRTIELPDELCEAVWQRQSK